MLEAIAGLLARGSPIRTMLDASYLSPLTFLPRIHTALLSDSLSSAFFLNLVIHASSLVDAVCHVLLGQRVPRGDLAASSIGTYDDLQALGIFIDDACESKGEIVPIMSPLQLVRWATSVSSCRPPCFADDRNQFGVFLRSILNMFSAANLYDWATFEHFHLRTLMRTLHIAFFHANS